MKFKSKILLLSLWGILSACSSGGGKAIAPPPPPANLGQAEAVLTTPDKVNLLTAQNPISYEASAKNAGIIEIDETISYQDFIGVGAAITDASGILIQGLEPQKRDQLISEIFSKSGLDLSFSRLTIGASDFSPNHYSFDDMPNGQRDDSLAHFSLLPIKDTVLPTVKSAIAMNSRLKIMASPWSAPNWMKTTNSMIGGTLKPDAYSAFADYFVKYTTQMRENGVNIDYVSVQNEPNFTPNDYPGMKLTPAQRIDFVKNHLGPKFSAFENAPKILEWDHNWDLPNQPKEVLSDSDAAKFYDGVAWHCYGGDVSAQSQVKDAFPTKNVYFTECSGGEWGKDWNDGFGWQVKNLIIGATRNHARGVLMWNLALDENFGPHLGGCGDCRGVFTINSKTGEITRNMEYYALGHISKFVKPGAVRIQSNNIDGKIDNVAFKNVDGSVFVIVVNTSGLDKTLSIKYQNKFLNLALARGAAMTINLK